VRVRNWTIKPAAADNKVPGSRDVVVVVVVVVAMTSPSGTAYMGGQRGPEEMRNSTRL